MQIAIKCGGLESNLAPFLNVKVLGQMPYHMPSNMHAYMTGRETPLVSLSKLTKAMSGCDDALHNLLAQLAYYHSTVLTK